MNMYYFAGSVFAFGLACVFFKVFPQVMKLRDESRKEERARWARKIKYSEQGDFSRMMDEVRLKGGKSIALYH